MNDKDVDALLERIGEYFKNVEWADEIECPFCIQHRWLVYLALIILEQRAEIERLELEIQFHLDLHKQTVKKNTKTREAKARIIERIEILNERDVKKIVSGQDARAPHLTIFNDFFDIIEEELG